MEAFIPKPAVPPEKRIQNGIIGELRRLGWMAQNTVGNQFQAGFPDIFAAHVRYGARWIEVKRPTGSKLEESQVETFTEFSKRRIGVWILTGQHASEINKLFGQPNWYFFLDVMKPVTRTRQTNKKPWERNTALASKGPEREIQEALKLELTDKGWYCLETRSSIYQYGLPDLYCCHREFGSRWIEVKTTKGCFTPAQLQTFPLMSAHGVGTWVLRDVLEIPKLFQEPNWWQYK